MLPESKFPVTGGTMQTEEVVPRAQSTGINSCLTESTPFQPHLHHSVHIKCPLLPPLIHMAVKQEPQEEEEQRGREANTLSPQADAKSIQTSIDGDVSLGPQKDQIQGLEGNAGQSIPDLGTRGRPSRGRRKSRWKLKFHHQALPPEYLDHYEASLAQEALNVSSPTHLGEQTPSSPAPTSSTSTPSPIADVQSWLQRIAAMQQELCPQVVSPQNQNQSTVNVGNQSASSSRRSVITSTSSHNHNNHNNNQNHQQQQQTQPSTRPPMKYSDLPYMGEITLDNSKPRRGRKPKKADICHLIYKNYGTILPGTPGHEEKRLSPNQKVEFCDNTTPSIGQQQQQQQQQQQGVSFQRTDVQNRISSLLEKRLTQESRRHFLMAENQAAIKEQEEPLNLCIRDLNQLKIRLLRKHGNIYESGRVKSEASSDGEDIECLGTGLNNIDSEKNHIERTIERIGNVNHNNNNIIDPVLSQNPGFVYWPSTGIFIHPMALQSQLLYYQKIAENEKCSPRNMINNNNDQNYSKEPKIVPKSIYSMLNTKNELTTTTTTTTTTAATTTTTPTATPPIPPPPQPLPASPLPPNQSNSVQMVSSPSGSPRSKRNAPIGQMGQGQPTKRKRSAIFIPPMPTENNNNPATEVSICKFKFTGGAKPSLQEKKSLSVDSGGNFRYYSGTGDKSMRGYEFFPREALQQPPGQSGSSAGAFLNAAGEKLSSPISSRPPSSSSQEDNRRKRKTRKSLQREKLEQTFKEKGFLIQTQQLESAEGATYCKFRQLRKFTRYLFRSWKDYLPGNVRELTGTTPDGEIVEGEENEPTGIIANSQIPHPNMVDVSTGFVDDSRNVSLT